jgi:hypothetical protein
MKIPNLEESPEVRAAKQRLQELASREQLLNDLVDQLNARKQGGLSNEEKEAQVAAVARRKSYPERH